MKLSILYFSRYRETLGLDDETLEGEFTSVAQLRDYLVSRSGVWQVLAERNLMCARNQEMCGFDEVLADGDEVGFFPTVTGG